MRGKPSTLGSHNDYVYIKENFEEEFWKPRWQAMWDLRKMWKPVGVIDDKSKGIEDATHRLIELTDDMSSGAEGEEKKTQWQQEVWVDNPMSDFFRMGFTEAEVKAALGI